MGNPIPEIGEMSPNEKLALMERLWDSMSDSGELTEPPPWHFDELSKRENEWKDRQRCSQDWETAKDEIRSKLR